MTWNFYKYQDLSILAIYMYIKWIAAQLVEYKAWVRLYNTSFNTLRRSQNGRHFVDDTFKRIFWNQHIKNSIDISLKFVPKGRIHNITSLVQIMAWRRPDDKPFSAPMMVRLPTHICVTRPQCVKACHFANRVAVVPTLMQYNNKKHF